jgi:hypothetical protein
VSIPKWVIPALILGTLVLAGGATAAVTGGTYSGSARFTLDGTHVSHPFSLTVKKGEIAAVAFVLTGNCGDLEATAGLNVTIPVTKGAFDSSISVNGDTVKLVGAFKGSKVTGTMSGKLYASAVKKHCTAIPAAFSAGRV